MNGAKLCIVLSKRLRWFVAQPSALEAAFWKRPLFPWSPDQISTKNQRGFEDNFSECDNVASDSFAVLENTARKCFLFSWFCIIRSWLMKLHKRRRRQHWFQFAMAASSWFFVEITANFLPQWKASRPTQQGLRCPCSKGWPCMVCGRSCWTRSALEQGKSCCCMRAHKAVPSHLNLCVNICIIMYYILRPCIHFTYWQICKCNPQPLNACFGGGTYEKKYFINLCIYIYIIFLYIFIIFYIFLYYYIIL